MGTEKYIYFKIVFLLYPPSAVSAVLALFFLVFVFADLECQILGCGLNSTEASGRTAAWLGHTAILPKTAAPQVSTASNTCQ